MISPSEYKLTEYSHGAGCGCKISPEILESIVAPGTFLEPDPRLLVGNSSKDDAAAFDLGDGQVILSTTDFFMPIADDPSDFGRIAATNAISDIYAMGGEPIMAIAILGWPVNVLPATVAQQVVEGGRQVCAESGMGLGGGHSIDSPEPIFGLAVTGRVDRAHLKQNNTAEPGCKLYLTKPLGVGVLTTAQKQKKLRPEHTQLAPQLMCRLNRIGAELGPMTAVRAVTDVTGFGLLGHLLEICQGSGVDAVVEEAAVPVLEPVAEYLGQGCVPGGTQRNFDSYGDQVGSLTERQRNLLCDPQTSGGLLIAVQPEGEAALREKLAAAGLYAEPIGELRERGGGPRIEVR